ncbi:MAG: ribonuclease activity regulator RraA [Hyphomicrobiaceae bacterium]|nr:MAG: ribonuclease activity regulator RraA [Hyphomicrobiaceae bacterium]
MPERQLSDEARRLLKSVSVATLTTCLFKRGLKNQLIQGVAPINPNAPRMVGEAYTLRTIPAREDLTTMAAIADRKYPQRAAIEDCPPGHVLVIDSRKDARAASGGDILLTRLMVRGVAGAVTDGGFRDSPEIARLQFPSYQARPAPPISLILHNAVETQVPIGCGDAPVYPGDIVVGDGEGVVVVPEAIAEEIANEAFEQTAYEDFVVDKVKEGRPIFGLYPASDAAKAEFALWRKEKGRR